MEIITKGITMFKIFNKNQHKFANSIFYKISDVLASYEEFKKNKHNNITYQGIEFNNKNKYLDLLLLYLKTNKEFRCSICGCKANHFRVCRETGGNLVFHLFGINHIKGTKDAEYLFFNKDHVIPVSCGGYSYKNNLRLTCERCNIARQNDTTCVNADVMNNIKMDQFKITMIHYLSELKNSTVGKDKIFFTTVIDKIRHASDEQLNFLID